MRAAFWINVSCLGLAYGLVAAPGLAQSPQEAAVDASSDQEIVVTARKRQETDISVPVAISAFSTQQIERAAILSMHDIAQRTPALTIADNTSGTGGNIFLRGIGTIADVSSSLDQSISFNIDGAPISRGNAARIGQYDLGQIEILKGPQALFFGKNSPAGVISLKSKDPGREFELMGRAGYEPEANNRLAQFAISGPVSDWLRARLFAHFSKTDGTNRNRSALGLPANNILPGAVVAHPSRHGWAYKEQFYRATALIEPNDRFTARLMASYNKLSGDGNGVSRELFYCPQGRAQTATLAAFMGATGAAIPALANALSVDDCKLNNTVSHGGINPAFLTAANIFSKSPKGTSSNELSANVADLNYRLSDDINLTSVSAYVWLRDRNIDHFTWNPGNIPFITYYNFVRQKQFTQEFRITSSLDSPLNFMVGSFYQNAKLDTFAALTGVAPNNVFNFHIPNKVYSGFGQLIWHITPQIELAGGARYTREKKSLVLTRDGVPQPTANPDVTFNNTSPEATLTWRPSTRLTAYAAYKTGFKSGGYASTLAGNGPSLPVAPARDFLYQPEKAKGFEVGVKALVADRQLRLDATVYSYKFTNLQVSNVQAAGATVFQNVINAASSKQRGAEVSATYHPQQVPGLRIDATANYNKARFNSFIAPCFIGQSVAEGCSLVPAGTAFTRQSLDGQRLPNAPLWVGSLGFNYETSVSEGIKVEFGSDAVYRSSTNVTVDKTPGGLQKKWAELNAHVRLLSEGNSWELGLFAKNLTDVRRALNSSNVPLTGNAATTGTAGGNTANRADLAGNPNPSRAFFLQLTLRPSAWMK